MDNMDGIQHIAEESDITPVQNKKMKSNAFKEKECKVISYNEKSKSLDVNFEGFGIRIKNVNHFEGQTVVIKYKGEIGKSNFEYKI